MTEILKVEDVNTEFNIYHKYLIRKYKKKTIRNFNKEMTKAVQEGRVGFPVEYVEPYIPALQTMNKNAMQEGISQGIKEVSEIYPILKGSNLFRNDYFYLRGDK